MLLDLHFGLPGEEATERMAALFIARECRSHAVSSRWDRPTVKRRIGFWAHVPRIASISGVMTDRNASCNRGSMNG